jgi:hypothetical protein
VSVYHWLVLREDRRELPPEIPDEEGPAVPGTPVARELIALAHQSAQDSVNALESRLGVPIRVWRRLDRGDAPQLTEDQLDAARDEIVNSPGNRALLILDASGVRVLPYRETQ